VRYGQFAGAVCEIFGPAHVDQPVEDWIEEMELVNWSQGKPIPERRYVTVAAATRLASRMQSRYERIRRLARTRRRDNPPVGKCRDQMVEAGGVGIFGRVEKTELIENSRLSKRTILEKHA